MKNDFMKNYKAARAVSKQIRESSTYFQNFYDSFKMAQKDSKDNPIMISIIDHKTPVERWEYKYGYIKYWKKFQRDLTSDQHSFVWDTKERVLLPFKEYVTAAMNDPVSPRHYMSGMIATLFMHSPAGANVHFI